MRRWVILLMLCAGSGWAGEVGEARHRLAKVAAAEGAEYMELRDRVAAEVSAHQLLRAANDDRLNWQERLVARICYERMVRGKEIEALISHDWRQHPGFDRDWEHTLGGAGFRMQPLAITYLTKTGLWYYYIEMTWKQTGEVTVSPLKHINEPWQRWCRMALAGRPEEVLLHRAMAERLEKDERLEADDAVQLYKELLRAKYADAVPVLVRRYEAYNKREIRGTEYFAGRHAQLYRGMFQPILDMADERHVELLESYMARQPWLVELLPALAEVRERAPVEAPAEPPLSMGIDGTTDGDHRLETIDSTQGVSGDSSQ